MPRLLDPGDGDAIGLDDLVARFDRNFGAGGAVGDFVAEFDQFAADRHVIDHLRIITRGKGADGRAGKAHQIGRPAQFLEPLVILEKGLERHRRG